MNKRWFKYCVSHTIISALQLVHINCFADTQGSIADEIRYEALLGNNDSIGRPLPLAASWNTGEYEGTFHPAYQLRLIEEGNYLLPSFHLDMPTQYVSYLKISSYYKDALQKASNLHLPIAFLSTQWERLLSEDPKYLNSTATENPNVLIENEKAIAKVSPFGPQNAWNEIGKTWTSTQEMKKIQEWYPNPPLILFISNNEHEKLVWKDAQTDKHYTAQYPANLSENLKRKYFGDAWIEHYRTLQEGLREGLSRQEWKENAKFIGYDAFGDPSFGRWAGWIEYSLITDGRFSPWPLAWDGASPSYYVNDWNESTDYTVFSPQIQSMNMVFMLEDAYHFNPDYWFELSTWDGHQPNQPSDKRAYYKKLGQSYSPQRYAGMIKFGMWILHPRVVREFRNPQEKLLKTNPYFTEILNAVNEIHKRPLLKKFWRKGKLVANRKHQHPYQSNIPNEYSSKDRWFLLDANVNPNWPWRLETEIPVFALANELGLPPHREWLIYLHSPLQTLRDVIVTIPGFGDINLETNPAGKYYFISEEKRTAEPL